MFADIDEQKMYPKIGINVLVVRKERVVKVKKEKSFLTLLERLGLETHFNTHCLWASYV